MTISCDIHMIACYRLHNTIYHMHSASAAWHLHNYKYMYVRVETVDGAMEEMFIYIPHLRVTVERKLVNEAIVPCIKDLGYEKPKEFQIDVVREFVGGRDVFASVPTGSGESICYACTPLVFDKLREHDNSGTTSGHCITAIVSSLTALMQDQTAKF